MKRFQVIRTHTSPYQNQDFLLKEELMVKNFDGLEYKTLSNYDDCETIFITNTHTSLKKIPTEILKNTKLIIHPNSGYDHFCEEFNLWKSIPIIIGHTIRAQAVAEYSIAALFEGLIELPQHMCWNKERNWNRTLLKDSSVWIFGNGHIGKIISETLKTLGVCVTIVDPFSESGLKNWQSGNISDARAIILACSLNQTSNKMFNQEFFESLGEQVLFINGARGQLVDSNALREYLLSHPKSFAFLDTFSEEPFGDEWHGFPQVWKTSHIAGVEKDLDQKILNFEKEVLKDFLGTNEAQFLTKYKAELLQNKWKQGVLV